MTRDAMIGAVVLVIVAGGAGWYVLTRPEPPAPVYSGEIIEESEFYSIKAEYPPTTPLKESAGVRADSLAVAFLKTEVEDGVRGFKTGTDPSQISEEFKKEMGLGTERKYTLQISYQATTSPVSVTYIFMSYEDTFGAHPNANYLTETFDLKSGEHLVLKDLFVFGAKYLDVLSDIARAKLPGQIAALGNIPVEQVDLASIESGTEPTEMNFHNFYLASDTLTLIFTPYQVGSWAIGPQSVTIPRADLKNILKPAYQ